MDHFFGNLGAKLYWCPLDGSWASNLENIKMLPIKEFKFRPQEWNQQTKEKKQRKKQRKRKNKGKKTKKKREKTTQDISA